MEVEECNFYENDRGIEVHAWSKTGGSFFVFGKHFTPNTCVKNYELSCNIKNF